MPNYEIIPCQELLLAASACPLCRKEEKADDVQCVSQSLLEGAADTTHQNILAGALGLGALPYPQFLWQSSHDSCVVKEGRWSGAAGVTSPAWKLSLVSAYSLSPHFQVQIPVRFLPRPFGVSYQFSPVFMLLI